jgi:hypothetical protein
MVNKCMRLSEILKEESDVIDTSAVDSKVDPALLRAKERERQEEEGIDPDLDEIIQDFPT